MFLASRKIIESVDHAWYWLGGISLVLFIGIMACLVGFAIRYHRSRHPKAEHIPGSFKLEIAWTILPTLLSVWLFFLGLEGFQLMRNPPPGAYEISVEARQWAWTFTYPNEDVSSSELYVPVDTPIKLNLSSPIGDVLHSFYLPDFRVKEDCVPGQPTYLWFEADRETGDTPHNIFCAEFCGKDHARMLSRLHVLSKAEFAQWLDDKVAHRYRPIEIEKVMVADSADLVACNAPALYQTYCMSCHGAGGQGGLVEGARDFRSLEKWKRTPRVVDIFRTLTDGLEGTQMRAFNNLSAWDRFALAYRVADFYEGADWPASTRADFEELIKQYKLDEQPVIQRSFPIEQTIEDMSKEAQVDAPGR
jgi:cytochrome c oxidase subunit 2